MTRKRFVKLLMATGYSRNEANHIAQERKKGQSYGELYALKIFADMFPEIITEFQRRLRESIDTLMDRIWPGIVNLREAALKAAQNLDAAMSSVTENMNRLQEADEGNPSE